MATKTSFMFHICKKKQRKENDNVYGIHYWLLHAYSEVKRVNHLQRGKGKAQSRILLPEAVVVSEEKECMASVEMGSQFSSVF